MVWHLQLDVACWLPPRNYHNPFLQMGKKLKMPPPHLHLHWPNPEGRAAAVSQASPIAGREWYSGRYEMGQTNLNITFNCFTDNFVLTGEKVFRVELQSAGLCGALPESLPAAEECHGGAVWAADCLRPGPATGLLCCPAAAVHPPSYACES